MSLDFKAPFGTDLTLKPEQDVGVVGGKTGDYSFLIDREELIQRVIRRLMTYRGEWIPFPSYGGSLRRYVGETLTQQVLMRLQGDIVAQLLQEPDIVSIPAPDVVFSFLENGLVATIRFYTTALQPISFTFSTNDPDLFTVLPAGV